MALVEKAFGDIITFTRASGGGRVNSLGQFEWVGTNVPRLTHDPVTLQPLGLLVEEQRTNLAVKSGDFTSASWSKLGGPVITPLTKGQRIDFPAQLDLVAQNTQSIAANTPHTVFVIAARDSGKCTLRITKGDSSQSVRATLDTAARTLVFRSVTGTGVFVSATVTPFESGWDIYALTGSFTAAQVSMGPMLVRESASETTITILGVQFEIGAAPSSYIPTEASQVTRAADVCSVNTLSPWFNALEGTLVVSMIDRRPSGAGGFTVSLGTDSANYMACGYTTQAGPVGTVFARVSGAGPTLSDGTSRNKQAFAYGGGLLRASNDGLPAISAALPAPPACTAMTIGRGHFGPSVTMNCIIQSITYYPRVIDVQQASA